MSEYRKRPVVVDATQWFQPGDHPEDYTGPREAMVGGVQQTVSGAECKERGWEPGIVRYFRHPDVSGESLCKHCGFTMHVHGWIDTLEGGHIVCPADWVITGVRGERYPCKPDIFAATYEPA